MRDCTILGASEVWNGSSVHPHVLNANSEATVEIGIANISCASRDSVLYLLVLYFHQAVY